MAAYRSINAQIESLMDVVQDYHNFQATDEETSGALHDDASALDDANQKLKNLVSIFSSAGGQPPKDQKWDQR